MDPLDRIQRLEVNSANMRALEQPVVEVGDAENGGGGGVGGGGGDGSEGPRNMTYYNFVDVGACLKIYYQR